MIFNFMSENSKNKQVLRDLLTKVYLLDDVEKKTLKVVTDQLQFIKEDLEIIAEQLETLLTVSTYLLRILNKAPAKNSDLISSLISTQLQIKQLNHKLIK